MLFSVKFVSDNYSEVDMPLSSLPSDYWHQTYRSY